MTGDRSIAERATAYAAILRNNARLSDVHVSAARPTAKTAQILVLGTSVELHVEGVIDFAKERERLKKEIARNEKDVTVARGKLANEAFVAKAPIEVVEENRERIASGEAAVIKLKEALSRIAE